MRLVSDKLRLLLEDIFLIYCAWVAFFSFLDTTTVSFAWKSEILNPIRAILFALVCMSILTKKEWTKLEAAEVVLILMAFIGSYMTFHRRFIVDAAVLIIGAKNIDFKKILKVYLAASMAAFVLSVILSQIGITQNFVFVQEKRSLRNVRYSFGHLYVTDFCAHLLFLSGIAVLLLINYERKVIGAVFLLEALFCFWFCGAFTATICFGILFCMYYYTFYLKKVNAKENKKGWAFLMAVPAFFSEIMIALSLVYGKDINWMNTLNRLMHERLSYGKEGFERYPVTCFGQYVELRGNGGSEVTPKDYFFLDCSYVNILLCHGIVMLVAVILIMTVNIYKAWKIEARFLLVMLVIVCVDSIMEHHLGDIAYNPFLMMIFANVSWMKEKTV